MKVTPLIFWNFRMKAKLTFKSTALTIDEIKEQARNAFGNFPPVVEIYPDGNEPEDYLYFGIQQLITHDLLNIIFDSGPIYPQKLIELRRETLLKLETILNRVIVDTEHKVLED